MARCLRPGDAKPHLFSEWDSESDDTVTSAPESNATAIHTVHDVALAAGMTTPASEVHGRLKGDISDLRTAPGPRSADQELASRWRSAGAARRVAAPPQKAPH